MKIMCWVSGVLKICMVRLVVRKINGKLNVFQVVWKFKMEMGS